MSRSGPGLGLQQIQDGTWKPLDVRGLDGSSVIANALFMDRENTMWIGTESQGLYRVSGGQVDHFFRADGLSGDAVNGFYEDREGNIWVATSEGLDVFRKTRMVSVSVREGLLANQAASVLAARDGTVWIGNQGALDALRAGQVTSITPRQGLPGSSVTSLLEDRSGRLWVGVDNGLAVYEQGRFRPVTRGDGTPLGAIIAMTEDRANNVWAVAIGTPRRLIRITNFRVREDIPVPQLPAMATVAADPDQGIWLGLDSGDLARYRKGQLELVHFQSQGRTAVQQVVATSDGSALGATNLGLVGWRNGTVRTLTTQNGLPCNNVYALIFDARGALWLYTACGLISIENTELQKWWAQGNTVLEVRAFDVLDGVRPATASFAPRASRGLDGRLWFATDTVVQMIDPADQAEHTLPPLVHIEQVIADRKSYPAAGTIRLPPLTRDLEIDYVGLSYVAPQKVRFRYRLEGRDESWQESGSRRQSFYSDLRPGRYRFRVLASNSEGIWNEADAPLDIVVAPAWYQTTWFLVVSVTTSLLALWALYQLRIRQVARSLNARFDERLGERTRMARDLHDTLLQTVQGSKMVADNALSRSDADGDLRRAMEQVSTWLGQASAEGRAAVNAMRASTTETNDLSEALRRAMDDCRRQGSLETSVSVSGDPREMHPVVRDEVYRIGYEAIRNACTHSGGTRLDVRLSYARDLVVCVSDNGVGIDPAVARDGKEGHFGLQGMHERATRIGATLTVARSGHAGTEITMVVPGRVIFRDHASSLFDRMKARLTS
jgi:signal transduction histidine kinase